jgi:hypothetical protein
VLFGPRADAWLFAGPIAFAAAALALHRALGLGEEVGLAAWLVFVVGVDVAHVWSTLWVSVLHGAQRRAHGVAFAALAAALYLAGAALHGALGSAAFWRVVAYVACFHFVRQQIGWVHLARARAGEFDRVGARLDAAVVTLAALEPLAYWHVHGRGFGWMAANDFVRLPSSTLVVVRVAFVVVAMLFLMREAHALARGDAHVGKLAVVLSTAVGWHLAIEAWDSDVAFTAFNTTGHAAPYVWLVATRAEPGTLASRALRSTAAALLFVAVLVAFGLAEESLWEALVWGDHGFPEPPPWAHALAPAIVPLLVLPQLVHYALDAVLWRRAHTPSLRDATSP